MFEYRLRVIAPAARVCAKILNILTHCMYMYTHIHARAHIHARVHIQTYKHLHPHLHLNSLAHLYPHSHSHSHTHMHTHTHTYTRHTSKSRSNSVKFGVERGDACGVIPESDEELKSVRIGLGFDEPRSSRLKGGGDFE